MSDTESIGSIISRGRLPGPRKGKQRLDLLSVNWEHIVGDRIGLHSRPTKLTRGTLTIAADGPAWAAEVSMSTDKVLKRAEAVLGPEMVKKIRVRSSDEGSGERLTKAEKGPGKTGGEADLPDGPLGEEIRALEDTEMSAALARMVRASRTFEQSRQEGE